MRTAVVCAMAAAVGCTDTVEIDVAVIDPCNQPAVSSMALLTFIPRGEGLDSDALSTTVDVASGAGEPFDIPLVPDFDMTVLGYRDFADFEQGRTAGLGRSAKYDLTGATDRVTVAVPFARLDEFHRTTAVGEEARCSSMRISRYGHTATYLPERRQVLIVGGVSIDALDASEVTYPRLVELYDPDSGTFADLGELPVNAGRAFHTATLLDDGRVLIVGGERNNGGNDESLRSALVLDVDSPSRPTVLEMRVARSGHRALRMDDGRVLIIGGRTAANGQQDYLTSVEAYDPAQGIFLLPRDIQGNALQMTAARYGHSATRVGNGLVFIAGGRNADGPVNAPEVLRPVGPNAYDAVASSAEVGVGAIFHAASLDPASGGVLLSGGYARTEDAEPSVGLPVNPVGVAEVWVVDAVGVAARACSAALNAARGLHTQAIAGNRAVFIGGRSATGRTLSDSEWAPLNPSLEASPEGQGCFAASPISVPMSEPRADHAITSIGHLGTVLISGGRTADMTETIERSAQSSEVFSPARAP